MYVQVLHPTKYALSEFEKMFHIFVIDPMKQCPTRIADTYNPWALECVSREVNSRGRTLIEALEKLVAVLVNEDHVNTFRKGDSIFFVPLTFVSLVLSDDMFWHFRKGFIHSNHQAILSDLLKEPLGRKAEWMSA